MKTPLKSEINFKAVSYLKKIIKPKSKISSFFLYSGQVEVALAASDRMVIAHTNKIPIYDFWSLLLEDPESIYRVVNYMYPLLSDYEIQLLQETWLTYKNRNLRNSLFYILNRCSETGVASSGNLDRHSFNPLATTRLRGFKLQNLYLSFDRCKNPIEAFDDAKRTDYLLLPIGKFNHNLFEHGKSKGADETLIDHRAINEKLLSIDRRWVVLYKNSKYVLEMYKNCNINMFDMHGRRTMDKNRCQELIIANF